MNLEPRKYSMARRSLQAQATRERIREVASELYREQPENFTLKTVAEKAATTVQTVLRVFGSKAALITLLRSAGSAAQTEKRRPTQDVVKAIRELYDTYETSPDTTEPTEADRAAHRAWVEQHLMPPAGLPADTSTPTTLFGLIAATDRATWRFLRQDLGLYRRAAEAVVMAMIAGLTTR